MVTTMTAKCPVCGSGIEKLYAEVPTAYPIVLVQGSGCSYDKSMGIPRNGTLDEETLVSCQRCGTVAKWQEFCQSASDDFVETFDTDTDTDTDTDGNYCNFHNFYHCNCGEEWSDWWSCACNDRCPKCNKETEPFESEEW